MRFKRYGHFTLNWTSRKAAAAARRQQRERDAFPLLAELIREEQPSIEQVRFQREADALVVDFHFRAFRAA